MAEISNHEKNGNHVPKRSSKKNAIHLDMTPMVDLAFLLLTFFMLTSVFTKQKVMDITAPAPSEMTTEVNIDNVMILFPQPDGKMVYKLGKDETIHKIENGNKELRTLFMSHASNPEFWVIIKSHDHAKYEQIVTVFDLLRETKMPHYCMEDRDKEDKAMLAQL